MLVKSLCASLRHSEALHAKSQSSRYQAWLVLSQLEAQLCHPTWRCIRTYGVICFFTQRRKHSTQYWKLYLYILLFVNSGEKKFLEEKMKCKEHVVSSVCIEILWRLQVMVFQLLEQYEQVKSYLVHGEDFSVTMWLDTSQKHRNIWRFARCMKNTSTSWQLS